MKRRTDQQAGRQSNGTYLDKAAKRKKMIFKNEDIHRTYATTSRITFMLQGSQKEKRHKGAENIFEEMVESFLDLGKESISRSGKPR